MRVRPTSWLLLLALGLALAGAPSPSRADGGDEGAAPPASPAEPGQPWLVGMLSFEGLSNLSPAEARAVMETKSAGVLGLAEATAFDRLKLARDEVRLTKLYQEYGYFNAEVTSRVDYLAATHRVHVTVIVRENQPATVAAVELFFPSPGAKALWEPLLRRDLPIREDKTFRLEDYQKAKAQLAQTLSDEARPLQKVEGQVRVSPESGQAVVVFRIDPGPFIRFGEVRLIGNRQVSARYIQKEVTFAKGQPFSLKELEKTQKALLDSGFFTHVVAEPVYRELKDDRVPVDLLVRERDPHSLRLGLGYGTEDLFRVRILQVNRDFLGLGDLLTFEGKISAIYEGLVGRWQVPFVFGRETQLVVAGGLEQKENEAFVNRRRFVRPLAASRSLYRWGWYLGYNLEVDRLEELKARVPDPDFERQSFFIASFPLGLSYDTRDSQLNPTRGFAVNLEVEASLSLLGSDLEYLRPTLGYSHVIPLPGWENWYWAFRAKAGVVTSLIDDQRIPLVRRFFAGGADSVRGYPYQKLGPLDGTGHPLGGEAMVEGGAELRFPLWKDLGGVVFLDAGNVYENLDAEFSLRFTTGLGLRYQTPVGPIRVDLGWQLNPPSGDQIDRYAVYLSVGQAF